MDEFIALQERGLELITREHRTPPEGANADISAISASITGLVVTGLHKSNLDRYINAVKVALETVYVLGRKDRTEAVDLEAIFGDALD